MEEIKQQLKWSTYRRKSSEADDRQVASLDSQERELVEKAKHEGIDVPEKYNLSESHSAKRPGRPVFGELLALIEHGRINALLVWSLNRISRNAVDTGLIIDLMDRGLLIEIRTPGQVFLNTPNDKFQLALYCGIAKQENDSKGVDVKRGLKEKAINGGKSGAATMGYKNYTDPNGSKSVIPDPDRFPIVRKMWDHMLTGQYSVADIVDLANDQWGFRSPIRKSGKGGKKITKSLVYYIFTRSFYYGEFEFPMGSKKIYQGNHKTMVTREEFNRVQVLLGRKGRPRPKTRTFTYRGPIRCGECGGSVTAEEKHHCVCSKCKHKFSYTHTTTCPKCNTDMADMKNPVTRDYVLYHCAKRTSPECTQRCINENELEKQITQELAKIEITPGFEGWALDALKRQNKDESAGRETILKAHRKGYDAVVVKLDNLIDMRAGKELDEEEYLRKKTTFLAEKARLNDLLENVDARINNWIEVAERGFSFAKTARARFEDDKSEDLHVRKEMFATLGSNYILKDKIISIEADNLLFAIRNVKESYEGSGATFEPAENGSVKSDYVALTYANPMLLPDKDSNLDKGLQRPLSYH